MNNYLLAIEAMKSMSRDGNKPLAGFNRTDYQGMFELAYQSYVPAFDAIEELYNSVAEPETMISNMAQSFTEEAAAQIDALPRRQKEQALMNHNMHLAVIVFPSILHYKGQSSKPLCDALVDAWKKAFPKSNVQPAEVEFIQKGFHHKWCYITTAACEVLGMEDTCYELNLLRSYRDEFMAKKENGFELIQKYYDVAPSIVKHINSRADKQEIYVSIWDQYIVPCIRYIEEGRNEECEEMYQRMVEDMKTAYFYVN